MPNAKFQDHKTPGSAEEDFSMLLPYHTVYPVTPNAGMFYQRGYKHLRRGNTHGKKTCNSRISIVPFSKITFQTLCKRAFLRNNGASKQQACVNYRYQRFHFVNYYFTTTILFHLMFFRCFLFILVHISN